MKIHIDIDCFFASAARIVDPSLEHKPIAIGGRSDTKIFSQEARQCINTANNGSFVPMFYKNYEERDDDLSNFMDSDGRIRGILTTASYEARKFGIKTAMSIAEALQLCPQLIIKAPNMTLYQKLSHELHEFLQTRVPLIEQASIDEFYGDLGGWIGEEEIEEFIDTLRHDIKRVTKLPVSIGAARTRYIAKLATSYAKPFGCKSIFTHNFDTFVNPIKVEDFAGIGRSMKAKLKSAQIHTLGELRRRRGTLESWGPYACELYKRVNGESDGEISTAHERKSIGISRTFDPIFSRDELRRRIHILARHLSYAVMKLEVIPTHYHLSIAYEMNQRSHADKTLCERFTEKKFDSLCIELFHQADTYRRLHVIRISISCSNFTKHSRRELSLIGFHEDEKMGRLTQNSHKMREKYGMGALKWGSELC